ncbi:hypothetical protein ANCCEY_00260 [Ancylostoma ceylanicum]|uniref:Uncharacterized protein n=1 Tax=Ancylostoma ceylanicum TaxID=53326 RepID=A0A0D6MDH9_9BILA|nr:hypothetical protein ANCCEY_00260 [Ancylostoma ceylanicum]
MIALERCIATIFLRKYYGNQTVGPLLVAAQYAGAYEGGTRQNIFDRVVYDCHKCRSGSLLITSALLLFVYFPTSFSGVIVYYCLAMSSVQPMYTVIPLCLTMLIQTTALLVFVKLKVVNKVKTELTSEIATTPERYQEELRKMWG